ncbi:hypothetical protein [Sphingomonas sp. TZW2008]|uniref:hypothetical protein n=1 Tax=Sphingomonas sp. TZW2008 TaxID=1917973 RepID=UPI000A26A711|nr:hypothetical protein [Sphingomonas sp. TZW2008]
MSKIYNDATKVDAEQGSVLLDGPGGVAVTITPDAALKTAGRLTDKAAEANGQRVEREWDEREREERRAIKPAK